MKTIKYNSPQNLPQIPLMPRDYSETINRPDTSSLENDMPTDPTRGRQPMLRDVLSVVSIFDIPMFYIIMCVLYYK